MVLNGCKEPFEREIRTYLQGHPDLNVNFIQTDSLGVSNARNLALDEAKGDYVTFIDDDDYVSPSYLEELYANSSMDTIALCYPFAFTDGDSKKQLKYSITNAYDQFSGRGKQLYLKSRKFFMGSYMKLIPTSFIQGRRFNPRFRNGEDSIFMFLISDKYQYVNYTSKNAVYYRRYRKNSAMTSRHSVIYIITNVLKLLMEYCRIYFSNPFGYSFRLYSRTLLSTVRGGYQLYKFNKEALRSLEQ